jgi:hypothetical protein
MSLAAMSHPADWTDPTGSDLLPRSSGTARGDVYVAAPGRYTAWLGGSIRSGIELLVDGRRVGGERDVLSEAGDYAELGSVQLGPGSHHVELRYAGPDAAPGSDAQPYPLGPLVFGTSTAVSPVALVPVADARSLCGASYDWIEAIGPK